MNRLRDIVGVSAVVAALALLPMSGAALAHGAHTKHAEHFRQYMDVYVDNIHALIASVEDIVSGYAPDKQYSQELDALVKQWESVGFHEAVETNAIALYPPIWAAIGAFSSAIESNASIETVRAKADAIKAALWQGYGALKLLAARGGDMDDDDGDHEDAEAVEQASGEDVVDTIQDKLDMVLIEYKEGETRAALELIHSTYMNYFEGIEGELIEQDPQLVSALEIDFNATLPGLIKDGAPADKVAARIEVMQENLDRAQELLEAAEAQESSVF